MKNKFEYKMNNLLLTNGLLSLITGIQFAISKGIHNWQSCLWWVGSIIWTYRYISYRKHGYLKIDALAIQINHANWKGLIKINKKDISKIDFTSKSFIVNLYNGKKIKIYKAYLVKTLIPDFEKVLNTEYNKQTFHNRLTDTVN